ncbi:hypothetical protein TDB9533_01239 [Thalassocella blandensis]|nr:hypothetical protein TDB9533_01239 [Thalassocella blandensis]
MATQAEIEELEKAINSGVKKVKYRDRETEYRSIEEMKGILRSMKRQLHNTRRVPYTSNGYSRRYQ